jgi:vanillate O-demethylase monooxygenase subunit
MGDPARADEKLVPNVHWFEDPAWTCVPGYHYMRANYRLLIDNLLDLSHESFVHSDTIGAAAVAESPVTAEIVEDEYVRVHRFMPNIEAAAHYIASGWEPRVDRWHTTYYTPPGAIVIANGTRPAGANDESGQKERRILNLVTPESATSTHYFWGNARKYALDDLELSAYNKQLSTRTFDQDKTMLEAQQRSIGSELNPAFPVTIKVDAGPVLGRRLLELMLDRERNGEQIPALSLPFVA